MYWVYMSHCVSHYEHLYASHSASLVSDQLGHQAQDYETQCVSHFAKLHGSQGNYAIHQMGNEDPHSRERKLLTMNYYQISSVFSGHSSDIS